jgi:hypothetical protein
MSSILQACSEQPPSGNRPGRRYRQVVVDMPPPNRMVEQLRVGGGAGIAGSVAAWGTCTIIGS